MSVTTEWFPERPIFRVMLIDNFVLTKCKRHNGGWLCKIDGYFKFPAYRGKKFRKSEKEEVKSKTATPLKEVAVLHVD